MSYFALGRGGLKTPVCWRPLFHMNFLFALVDGLISHTILSADATPHYTANYRWLIGESIRLLPASENL